MRPAEQLTRLARGGAAALVLVPAILTPSPALAAAVAASPPDSHLGTLIVLAAAGMVAGAQLYNDHRSNEAQASGRRSPHPECCGMPLPEFVIRPWLVIMNFAHTPRLQAELAAPAAFTGAATADVKQAAVLPTKAVKPPPGVAEGAPAEAPTAEAAPSGATAAADGSDAAPAAVLQIEVMAPS